MPYTLKPALSRRAHGSRLERSSLPYKPLVPVTQIQACCFADVGGHIARGPAELAAALDAAQRDMARSAHQPQLFEVDHIFGGHKSQGELPIPLAKLRACQASQVCRCTDVQVSFKQMEKWSSHTEAPRKRVGRAVS
eukprot:1138198-Pelagomonas_calceolata.AAC.5